MESIFIIIILYKIPSLLNNINMYIRFSLYILKIKFKASSNDVNVSNGNVEYVVLQHDNNEDSGRINTNSNEIQNHSHYTVPVSSFNSLQLQEDRRNGDQDNVG